MNNKTNKWIKKLAALAYRFLAAVVFAAVGARPAGPAEQQREHGCPVADRQLGVGAIGRQRDDVSGKFVSRDKAGLGTGMMAPDDGNVRPADAGGADPDEDLVVPGDGAVDAGDLRLAGGDVA